MRIPRLTTLLASGVLLGTTLASGQPTDQSVAAINQFFAQSEAPTESPTQISVVLVISGGERKPVVEEFARATLDRTQTALKISKHEKDSSVSLDATYALKEDGRTLVLDGPVKYEFNFPGGYAAHGSGICGIGGGGKLIAVELRQGSPAFLSGGGEPDPNNPKTTTLDLSVYLVWH